MLICMRTTIDIPDNLFKRARRHVSERGITIRALVLDSLERALGTEPQAFKLRDASAGFQAEPHRGISAEEIDRAIDDLRQPGGRR